MEIIEIVRTDFDSLENQVSNARIVSTIATFAGDKDGRSAHGRATDFIWNLPAERRYLGYDGVVYPQITIIEKESQ